MNLNKTEANKEQRPTDVASGAVLGIGSLVLTKIKNRWNLDCAGTIEAINGHTANVRVWNMNGPGADVLVTEIPMTELDPSI